VREALRDLQLLRLVESEPFRGSRVRVFDEKELAEIYPVRAVIEELAARLAAERLEGDVAALEEQLVAMKEAVTRGETVGLVEHDIAFHRLIVEASGNPVLVRCWEALGVESPITISLYGTFMDPKEAAERHARLIEAIRERNPDAAAREAREHVDVSAGLMRAHLEAHAE
jgi:DNA-binding GntR family transcriptional regulator